MGWLSKKGRKDDRAVSTRADRMPHNAVRHQPTMQQRCNNDTHLVDSGLGGRSKILEESIGRSVLHPVLVAVDGSSVLSGFFSVRNTVSFGIDDPQDKRTAGPWHGARRSGGLDKGGCRSNSRDGGQEQSVRKSGHGRNGVLLLWVSSVWEREQGFHFRSGSDETNRLVNDDERDNRLPTVES